MGPNRLLLAASMGDHEEIQQLVVKEGLSPSHVFLHGVTALHEASKAGHIEATKLLVEKGADVNKQVYIEHIHWNHSILDTLG